MINRTDKIRYTYIKKSILYILFTILILTLVISCIRRGCSIIAHIVFTFWLKITIDFTCLIAVHLLQISGD